MLAALGSEHPVQREDREKLIRRAHELLDEWDVGISPSKVKKLVVEYLARVQPRGIGFDAYLLRAVKDVDDARIRRLAGRVLGPDEKSGNFTAHRDHATGEPAAWNVFVHRDLPRLLQAGGPA